MLTKTDFGYYSVISLKGVRHAAQNLIQDNLSSGTRDIFPSLSHTARKDLKKVMAALVCKTFPLYIINTVF